MQFLSRKQLCKNFVLIQCFIKMKCLRSISGIKIQICLVKAVRMYLEYLFCFGVIDQIKHSNNQQLVTLHLGQWNVARGSMVTLHGQPLIQVKGFFYLKINFFFDFVSSSSRLLIISRVRNVFYGDSPLIRIKGY